MLSTDLKCYLPATVNNLATNGGRMSATAVTSGVVQNVWPHVQKAERTSGSKKYRKLFCKVADDSDGTLIAPQYWLDDVTAGDDWFTFFVGTMTDVMSDITGWATGADTERKYGIGSLKSDVTAATKTIVLDLEDTSLISGDDVIFVVGDTIRITDMVDPTSETGNEEFHEIDAISVSGTEMTITTVDNIENGYTTGNNGRAMTVYEPGDVECTFGTPVITSSAGTSDFTTYPLVGDNIAAIEQTITITFTDATNFTAASDVSGVSLTSGAKGTDWTPQNSDFSKPYLTLPADALTGTYAQNDTIVIACHPAAIAIWEKRVVPALAASQANNKITQVTAGEAA